MRIPARRCQTTRAVPEDVPDPTGIFQFEVKNEQLLGKAPKIREQLHYEVSFTLRAALAHYQPPPQQAYSAEERAAAGLTEGLPEHVTPLAAHKHVVNNVVALALAGNGSELLRVAQLSRYLAPFTIALSAEHAPSPGKAELAKAAVDEAAFAPPGVMNTLAAITAMPAGPGFDALMQLVDHRAQEATYAHWLSLVGRRAPLDTGEVIDFSAPSRARRAHDRDAAQHHLLADMHAALRSHSSLIPHMDEASLKEAVVEEALLQPVDFNEPLSHAAKVAVSAQQLRWYDACMPAIAVALENLPEADRELLWSLRSGRRSWRLDLADWGMLARALLGKEASPKPSAKLHPGASLAVQRVAMGVLLRGQFLAQRPKARKNPIALRAVAEAAQYLPERDLALLVDKWRTLQGPIAQRAVMRVLRYGQLNPDLSVAGGSSAAVVKASRRFVRAMLTQALLEAMPVSWVAWSGKLAAAVEDLPEARLQVFADALTLPHDLSEATISHAILHLIAPERLQAEHVFAYMHEVHRIWGDIGVQVTDVDAHLVRHLTPRIIERMSNMHGMPESGEPGRLLGEELLIEVASALGSMQTDGLMQLKAQLHRMTSQEVHGAINMAFDGVLHLMGSSKEEFLEQVKTASAAADTSEEVETGLEEQMQQEAAVETRIAHLDTFRATCWLPPEIMPMHMASVGEWTNHFHNLVYSLAGLLHDDSLQCRTDDWAKARLLYLLSEEVGLVTEGTSNTPASVAWLLNMIPFSGADARVGGSATPRVFTDPVDPSDSPNSPDLSHGQYGIYPATLELVNKALQELNSTMYVTRLEGEEVVETEVGSVETLDGLSANETIKLLIMAEAQRVVRAGGLLLPVLGAVRWGWENVPRNFGSTFVRYWGDSFSSETAPLEAAYACARLARKDEGLRIACSNLDFPQKLELAHVVAARRLQEAGALGDAEAQYVPVQDRLDMMVRECMKNINAAGGDAETAAVEARSSLGKYLDVLPTAEDAIDYFMSRSNAGADEVASGGDMVEMRMRRELNNEEDPEFARIDRVGAVSSKLAVAGDALLLPDLIQNIADRPIHEVMHFFEELQSLPANPDVQSLRQVFQWYEDGFLHGVNYEDDPVAAWRLFEQEYLQEKEVVRVRQRDQLNPTSTDPIVTNVYLHPKEPDLREMLTETPLEEQIRGVGIPQPQAHTRAQQAAAAGLASDLTLPSADELAALTASELRDIEVDAKGRALARGRRKASSARVWLSHGVGDVIVNKRPLGAYFTTAAQRAAVVAPLTALGRPGHWNVNATVEGGGRTGQAEAIQLGVARAMVKLAPESHRVLKAHGLLTRDPRVVETKKPAQKKARKKRAWVKR